MTRIVSKVITGGRGEDRVRVECLAGRALIVVADGAGGTGSGANAAQMSCDLAVAAFHRRPMSPDEWMAELRSIDRQVLDSRHGGESTLVAAEIDGEGVVGASVGDSAAWAIDPLNHIDLTEFQNRKPLVGTGRAVPMAFGPVVLQHRLMVATDGLLNYCPHADIRRLAVQGTLEEAIDALVSRTRLRSGGFQDDVSIALWEHTG